MPKSLTGGVSGTSRRYCGGFAKQVAGNAEDGETPTLLWKRLEIRLDKNLDGLCAGVDLDADSLVAKVDLVASSVLSSNDGVAALSSRFRGRRRHRAAFDRSRRSYRE